MKVKMIKDAMGSENGITLKTFLAGMVYDITSDLADAFVTHMKVAEYEEMEQPVVKFEIPEKSYKVVTLKDKPKKWVGMEIRSKDGGPKVEVIETRRGGIVLLSDDSVMTYQEIRKNWEMV